MNTNLQRKNIRRKTIREKIPLEHLSASPENFPSPDLKKTLPVNQLFGNTLNDFKSLESQQKQQLKSLKDGSEDKCSNNLISHFSKPETPGTQKSEQKCIQLILSPIKSPRCVQLKPLLNLSNHVSRAGYKSSGSSINGGKKIHSTSIFIKPSFQNTKGEYLFGITEGHGPFASFLSNSLASIFPNILETLIPRDYSLDKVHSSLNSCDEKVLEELKNNEKEIQFSGCSLSAVLVFGEAVFAVNVGDCQTVLAKFNGSWTSCQLGQVHDLSNFEERKRILEFGGKVCSDKKADNTGSSQDTFIDWKNNGVTYKQTRSIGDLSGKTVGIITKPEVEKFVIGTEDKFIIIGNSNFWKVISHQEAVNLAIDGWNTGKTDIINEALLKAVRNRLDLNKSKSSEFSLIVVFLTR